MDEKGATFICDLLRPREATPPPQNARRPAYLVVLGGGIPGAMLPLIEGGTTVGRSPENHVQLPDATVSREHARLDDDLGLARLTDLGSTNGSFLNDERIAPHRAIPIRDGDRLQFGSTLVVKFIRPDPREERFQRELFERSVRDPLTGLFNRSYFLDQIVLLAAKGSTRGLGVAVLMLDVDHFKRVNDTLGHEAGDAALRQVAEVLRQATRADDLVARYGGEEFVVAIPLGRLEQGLERAERIRRSLASRPIDHDGRTFSVTVSIGLAFAPAGTIRPLGLIGSADRYLYKAKEAGRDRIVAGPAVPPSAIEVPLTCDGEDLPPPPHLPSASLTSAEQPILGL